MAQNKIHQVGVKKRNKQKKKIRSNNNKKLNVYN